MNNVILDNKKLVGSIEGNLYKKSVNREKHLFRKFNGYGISKCVLDKLQQEGVTQIEIKEKDTKDTYRCSLEDYSRFGKEFLNQDDKQLILNLQHFEKQEK
jgi:hypothetical protein